MGCPGCILKILMQSSQQFLSYKPTYIHTYYHIRYLVRDCVFAAEKHMGVYSFERHFCYYDIIILLWLLFVQITKLLAQEPYMRLTAANALRHPFIRLDDSSIPSPRIFIDQVRLVYCQRYFSFSGSRLWNSLLLSVCDPSLTLIHSSVCSWLLCYYAEFVMHWQNASMTVIRSAMQTQILMLLLSVICVLSYIFRFYFFKTFSVLHFWDLFVVKCWCDLVFGKCAVQFFLWLLNLLH